MSGPAPPSFSAKIYGEIIAQVQGPNGTTQNVSCSADPNPNYLDLFQNHSAILSQDSSSLFHSKFAFQGHERPGLRP